jgi:hypothetical protein
MQAEHNDGNEIIYRMVETCTTEELEEKEAFYIAESDCYNTSLKTGTAMRDPEISAKAVASRLDQSGLNGNNIKQSKEMYLRVFNYLVQGKTPHEIVTLVDHALSNTTITRIRAGKVHEWLKDDDPVGYELMLRWSREDTERVNRGKLYDLKHKKGQLFSGNVAEIAEELGIGGDLFEKLLKKKLLFVKGWRVVSE